jgi:predicted DNA-binding protein
MVSENRCTSSMGNETEENFTVQLTNPMLYDRLHILSAEYSVSVEYLINEAVKRMINDVDFVRSLRNGKQD